MSLLLRALRFPFRLGGRLGDTLDQLKAAFGEWDARDETGRIYKTHEAYHLLVYCVCLFPDNQTIRYDIACYAARRGLVELRRYQQKTAAAFP
jgi:hypothetical protein